MKNLHGFASTQKDHTLVSWNEHGYYKQHVLYHNSNQNTHSFPIPVGRVIVKDLHI
jgi:hypothetical protein